MRRTAPLALVGVLAISAAITLGGCENTVVLRGFAATPGSVEKLEAGAQSREDVVRLIGSPSAVATFNPNIWYYISQTQEYWAYTKPEITSQKVMQVTFNETGRIDAIKSFDLKDAQDIRMVSRITPTSGKELTILEQVLGNVGRFSGPKSQGGSNPGAPTSGGGI
ncbi:MAG: outer membrane protein assembly factor BamE [Rhodospirillales bacterium]|nr:outer membrane protein assembly factor BamE [Rhodospirillales bacterium]